MALDVTDPPQSWADTYWTEGTGAVSYFGVNGHSTQENERRYVIDPWGRRGLAWCCQSNGIGSDGDGGWNSSYFSVDSSKLYRFSTWVNRYVVGTKGRFYFGLHGTGTTNGIYRLYTDPIQTNPYFWYTDNPPPESHMVEDTWYLVVGHVWPAGTTSAHTIKHKDSGVWEVDGTKHRPIHYDFAWHTSSTTANHRAYLYYCEGNTDAIQHMIFPRVDLCDGTEPTLKDLLRHGRSYLIANLLIN